MQRQHNVNVNENGFFKNPNNNNNVNVSRYTRAKAIDSLVEKLQAKLGCSPKSKPFLYKAAWKLSEAQIWDNVEKSQSGKNPIGLFIWLCKKEGV